jgi:hypothetical protein
MKFDGLYNVNLHIRQAKILISQLISCSLFSMQAINFKQNCVPHWGIRVLSIVSNLADLLTPGISVSQTNLFRPTKFWTNLFQPSKFRNNLSQTIIELGKNHKSFIITVSRYAVSLSAWWMESRKPASTVKLIIARVIQDDRMM